MTEYKIIKVTKYHEHKLVVSDKCEWVCPKGHKLYNAKVGDYVYSSKFGGLKLVKAEDK